MKPSIYRLDFPSGDFYIGATTNFSRRRSSHLATLLNPTRAGNVKLAALMRDNHTICIYEIASALSADTLHLLEQDVIADHAPTINVNRKVVPLPKCNISTKAKAPIPYGPYKSITEFALNAELTYQMAKRTVRSKAYDTWVSDKNKPQPEKPATHPPDPRRNTRCIWSGHGWECRATVRAVSDKCYKRRRERGWSEWEALTTPRIKPKKKELEVPYHTYWHRKKRGYSEAVASGTEPFIQRKPNVKRRTIEVDGVSKTIAGWALHIGVTSSVIHSRLSIGWTEAQAVGQHPPPVSDQKRKAAEKMAARKSRQLYCDESGNVGTVSDFARMLGVSWYKANEVVTKCTYYKKLNQAHPVSLPTPSRIDIPHKTS